MGTKKEEVKNIQIVVPEKGIPLRGMNYDSGVFIDGKRLPVRGVSFDFEIGEVEFFNVKIPARYVTLETV